MKYVVKNREKNTIVLIGTRAQCVVKSLTLNADYQTDAYYVEEYYKERGWAW